MATYEEELEAINRDIIYLLVLELDQCTLENGVAPCTATSPCHFTWFTCKDLNNYTKGTRQYKFCSRYARVPGALPLLSDNFTPVPTKIDSRRWKTERGEMRFRLSEDLPLALADPTKSTTEEEDFSLPGRFWSRLLARTPNTRGRFAKLYQGFVGVDIADWELKFQGRIEQIEWAENGVDIRVPDVLWKLGDVKIPNKVNSDNTLQLDYAGGSTMEVFDATQFSDATPEEPGAVLVEDEIVLYTGKNIPNGQLTGCVAGAFGTTAVTHSAGQKVEQILVFGGIDYSGIDADHIFMTLLGKYSEISHEYFNVLDYSLTLGANILATDTTIPVSPNTNDLPPSGIVKINDEFIRFYTKDATNIYSGSPWDPSVGDGRGMYGTDAAGHTSGDDVYVSEFTDELNRWTLGRRFRFKSKSAKQVNKHVSKMQEACMLDVWQAEDSIIHCKMQAPPIEDGTDIYETTIMVERSREVDRDEDNRFTRVLVYYEPGKIDPGDNEEDFDELDVWADPVLESDLVYDEVKPKTIWAWYIYQDSDGQWLSQHAYSKFRDGVPQIEFDAELYLDKELQVGDLVRLKVPEIVDEDGDYLIRIYRIISKKQHGDNMLQLEVEDTGFGDFRYARIGPINGVLDAAMNAVQLTADIDLNATTLTYADWRSGALHAVKIITPGGTNEMITYTTVTDLGGGKIRLSGLTRDADGVAGGGQVHNAGDECLQMYSAASDAMRDKYAWQGDSNNLLDSDADFTGDTEGTRIW